MVLLDVFSVSGSVWRSSLVGFEIFRGILKAYHKKMSKTFCLQEKNREGAVLVFLNASDMEKLSKSEVSPFFSFFCLMVPKNFAGELSMFLKASGIKNFCE